VRNIQDKRYRENKKILQKYPENLHEGKYTYFLGISRSILLTVRNIQDKSYRENKINLSKVPGKFT